VSIAIIIASVSFLSAQNYETGFGVRLGYPYGLNVKHFVNEVSALDATLYSTGKNIGIVALVDWHQDVENYKNWKWYWGPGAHVLFNIVPDQNGNTVLLGLDAVVGAEYTFNDAPISLSFDWVPSLNIIEDFGLSLFNAGVSVRYIF